MGWHPFDALHRLCRPVRTLPTAVPASTVRGDLGLVDIWSLNYTVDAMATVARLWEPLLPPGEQGRARRFRFAHHRLQYMAARALIRTVLSRYAATRPPDWRFESGPLGRPAVSSPLTTPRLHFNLSHTDGLVVCAVSVAHDAVGIDVECSERASRCEELMDIAFSRNERCFLNTLDPDERPTECLVRWTLKESYSKAIGMGVSASFDRLSFRSDGRDIRLPSAPFAGQRPACGWRFAVYEFDTPANIALSVYTAGAALAVRVGTLSPGECVPPSPAVRPGTALATS